MCIVQKGKVLEVKGKTAIVLVNGIKKEVRIADEVKVGDVIKVFQNIGFKR
jgi:hydrogenase maturation factor